MKPEHEKRRKNEKKALTVVLTLTMAATMFAGCGDKKTTGTTETTEAVSTEDERMIRQKQMR